MGDRAAGRAGGMEEQGAEAGLQAGAVAMGQHVGVAVVVRVGMARVHVMAVELVHVGGVRGPALSAEPIVPGVREAGGCCRAQAELGEAMAAPHARCVCCVKGCSAGEIGVHCGEAGRCLRGVATAPQGGT